MALFRLFLHELIRISAIRISEKPMVLIESKINRPGYKFSKHFR